MFNRMKHDKQHPTLDQIELFADCSPKELSRIESLVTMVHVPAGSRLMVQGGVADQFVVLSDGAAQVTRTVGDQRLQLADLGPGAFIGEMALLFGATRSASVTATSDVRAFVSNPSEFREIVRIAPSVARRIGDVAASRAASLSAAA